MTIDVTDPHAAPARTDLPFLRHRTTRPRPDLAPPPLPRIALPAGRICAGERAVLTTMAPMIALTRLQSGIGVLTVDAMWSGEPHIGCVYTMVGGHTATVRHDSRDLVTLGVRQGFERLTVDLRQNRRLARLMIYRAPGAGRGAIVVTTYGGARVELPVDRGVTVLMSIYNVDGEFVLRAELDAVEGTVRDACEAYGFDDIAWW